MTAYRGEWLLTSFLENRANCLGEKVAFEFVDGSVTFAETAGLAQRVAGGLRGLGVGPGDRVASMLEPSIASVAAWFGTAWSGAVEVPVNTELKGQFLAHVLNETESEVLIIDERLVDRLEGLDLLFLRHLVIVDAAQSAPREGPSGVAGHSFQSLLDAEPVAPVERREDDLLTIVYTSGTSGTSKGVMHTHRSGLFLMAGPCSVLDLGADDVGYSCLPLFHVTARSVIVSDVWAAGRTVIRPRFSRSQLWQDIRDHGVTWFPAMGAIILFLHSQDPSPDDADNPVRFILTSATPPSIVHDFEQRFGVQLLEMYGSTELGHATAPRRNRRVLGTAGWPLDHVALEIHDADDRPLPAGEVGEIVARPTKPNTMFSGYWRRPIETLNSFRNLWFHTGDAGFLDAEGSLVFVDRLKDSIRRRGQNISSFEVERAVNAFPDVLESAAYAVPSEVGEDDVMVALVLENGRDLDLPLFLDFCERTMPAYAVPRYIRILPDLPRTPTNRVKKVELREEGITPDALDRDALGTIGGS